ncbi:hypothetical protein ACPOLB_23415 [Rubrivivax sp. RP6-9]|uniref:hypothetical protein n=1 Tax=Rubrivivax sp. RP6-9 TaxID=3415750 RepID=UPI003CC5406F
MSYIASHLATVPSSGFTWYLIFIECPFVDDVQKEMDAHFHRLGQEAGTDALVVRGYRGSQFTTSVYEAPAFSDERWRARAKFPSLIVSSVPPQQALANTGALDSGKVMIFNLREIYDEKKSLAGFLADLVAALTKENALAALEDLDPGKLERGWGWLSKYMKMEPGFFGFNVKLDKVLKDVFSKM